MAAITIDNITKSYSRSTPVLRGVSMHVEHGERVAVVGPSGSGKSTLLRIVAGLDRPTTGRVFIGSQDVTDLPPERRDLAMVFQSYALYPHKTVRGNLAFGLTVRKVAPADIERRVVETAEILGLAGLLERLPSQLSGGQRQRVALGRAIVRQPDAFLFDEPLSNLDPRLRGETRAELLALHRRLGATMIYVTHDQEEAMTLGQRIAVVNAGELEQVGPPADVYGRPSSTFVAGFIGSPPMNLMPWAAVAGALDLPPTSSATLLGIRAQHVTVSPPGAPGIAARVAVTEWMGHAQVVRSVADSGTWVAMAPPDLALAVGDAVALGVDLTHAHAFGSDGRRIESADLRIAAAGL